MSAFFPPVILIQNYSFLIHRSFRTTKLETQCVENSNNKSSDNNTEEKKTMEVEEEENGKK